MNRIVFSLLAGLYVGLIGCRSIGTVDSTGVAGSAGAAGPKWTTGLLSKLKLRPRSESNDRLLSLARLMEHHGRHEEATKMYQAVLEHDPTDRTAFHRLGCLAVRRGEHDEGLEYFQLAASGGEVSAELLNDMGYVLYLKHDLKSAEAKLREALQKGPQFKHARNNLGLVLAEQGQHDEALAEFRAAGDEASAYSNLAFVQTKLGLLTEAEKNYHRALELDPQHRQAAEALVQFSQMGQKIEALAANQTAQVETLAANQKSGKQEGGKQGPDQQAQQLAEVPTSVDRVAADKVAAERSPRIVPLRGRGSQKLADVLTVVDHGASAIPAPVPPASPIQFAAFEEEVDASKPGDAGRNNPLEVADSLSDVSDRPPHSKSGDSASKPDESRVLAPQTTSVPASDESKNLPGFAKLSPSSSRLVWSTPRALLHTPTPTAVAPPSTVVVPVNGELPPRQSDPALR